MVMTTERPETETQTNTYNVVQPRHKGVIQARVIFPANKVFTSEYGNSQNIKFQALEDPSIEDVVWFEEGKEPYVNLKRDDIIDVVQLSNGKWRIAEGNKPSLQKKEAVVEAINELFPIYEHCLTIANALTSNLSGKATNIATINIANTLLAEAIQLTRR
ncbi:hypothetical protein [Synechococcus sp. PCC 6312]|uniref:hypothetical protein n=1 Tax=Synechococcus sp. (strain ATCC 27167 / PCC 6312) TaxID=195253 RepID=UPI00029F1560|nr:hypothetical protein [Synechococcus sp. PCC 6312]AFY61883.1 hypothetical protein Syn6312_2806 [Synechococcus sp. PCC 6312]